MSDFGEPWRPSHKDGGVDVRSVSIPSDSFADIGRFYEDEAAERALACVNALAGIADPETFVQRAKAMQVLLKTVYGRDLARDWTAQEIADLAAEWTPDVDDRRDDD